MGNTIKLWALFVACAALISFAVSGTMANSTAGDTLEIEQLEQQRIDKTSNDTAAGALTDFTDGVMLEPATYSGELPSTVTNAQGWTMYADDVQGAVDQFVSVQNRGTMDVYVRVWFAFEVGDDMTVADFKRMVHLNRNTADWEWTDFADTAEIDGQTYVIKLATYKRSLAAGIAVDAETEPVGECTAPSLVQMLLYRTVTDADAVRLDGNGDGEYDVMVVSQAVSEDTVWTAAFGDEHPWR